MKQGIHPNYVDCTITCACGNVIKTRSTKPEIHVEVCSKCHPFYTGKQKLVDTGGRVERFNKRFGRNSNYWLFQRRLLREAALFAFRGGIVFAFHTGLPQFEHNFRLK